MEDSHSQILSEEQDMEHRLHREIMDLEEAIVRFDIDTTVSEDSITKNTRRISDVLQRISDEKLDVKCFFFSPIRLEEITQKAACECIFW